ncbi:MAG TPA: hypothetical protein VGF15_00020, partial [Solirubrobacteraceae bacterium]
MPGTPPAAARFEICNPGPAWSRLRLLGDLTKPEEGGYAVSATGHEQTPLDDVRVADRVNFQ